MFRRVCCYFICWTGKNCCSKRQKFFSSSVIDWVDAESIIAGDNLLALDGNDVRVDFVKTVSERRKFNKISVDTYNNFFVTSKNLLVHNFWGSIAQSVLEAEVAQTFVGEVLPVITKNYDKIEAVAILGLEAMEAAKRAKSAKKSKKINLLLQKRRVSFVKE